MDIKLKEEQIRDLELKVQVGITQCQEVAGNSVYMFTVLSIISSGSSELLHYPV